MMSPFEEAARRFAILVHGDQKYGEEFPYCIHLQAVVSVLYRFGVDNQTILAAAWLHDVLEDTATEYSALSTFFGSDVADVVSAVTEPKEGNRKTRHENTYPRIRQNPLSLIVKLADRIANIESGGKKVGMYVKEYMSFKLELKDRSETSLPAEYVEVVKQMWHHLDMMMIDLVLSSPRKTS